MPETAAEAFLQVYKVVLDRYVHFQGSRFATAQTAGGVQLVEQGILHVTHPTGRGHSTNTSQNCGRSVQKCYTGPSECTISIVGSVGQSLVVRHQDPPQFLQRLEVPNCEKSKVPETAAEAVLHVYEVVLDRYVHFQKLPVRYSP